LQGKDCFVIVATAPLWISYLNKKMMKMFPDEYTNHNFISPEYAEMWKKWGDVIDILNAQTAKVEVSFKSLKIILTSKEWKKTKFLDQKLIIQDFVQYVVKYYDKDPRSYSWYVNPFQFVIKQGIGIS
jgi:hypothetical protein